MLVVPELKREKFTDPVKPLTEKDIQEKLYGIRWSDPAQAGVHPQLVQARVQIAQLEEELKVNEDREVELLARITDLEEEKRAVEKRFVRSQREQDRLEKRLSEYTAETPRTIGQQQRIVEASRIGIRKIQSLITRRPSE